MSSLMYRKGCKVCKAVKQSNALYKRLDRCSYYVPSSEDTPARIQRDHKDLFAYPSLLNHLKKHQLPNAKEITKSETRAVANKRTANYGDIWDIVLEKGKEGLETGTMPVNMNQVLLAARDKSNFEKQSKDQSLALMDMVFRFSAGEIGVSDVKKPREILESEASPSGTTREPTTSSDVKPLGPRDFYKSLAGDASPRRASPLPEGDNS